MVVFIFSMCQILTFTAGILNGKFMEDLTFDEIITKIFTNFVCQIYVVLYFKNYLQNKEPLLT
jgi:hypothetical protein